MSFKFEFEMLKVKFNLIYIGFCMIAEEPFRYILKPKFLNVLISERH